MTAFTGISLLAALALLLALSAILIDFWTNGCRIATRRPAKAPKYIRQMEGRREVIVELEEFSPCLPISHRANARPDTLAT